MKYLIAHDQVRFDMPTIQTIQAKTHKPTVRWWLCQKYELFFIQPKVEVSAQQYYYDIFLS